MDLDRLSSPASTVAQWRHSHSPATAGEPDLGEIRARTLDRGVNLPLYLLVRAILVPFFRIYLRLQGVGGEEVPRSGPLLLAANHRSFLDPFVIGALVRRPVYYVAKRELFARGWQAWLLRSLGAFPIDRGRSDQDAMATAKQILSRGDCVVIFPEGTRVRKGPLGAPRRGVGRLALETGAPVVPVAVIGTDQVRRGWRVRPRKVRVRFGRITRLPQMDEVSPSLAAAATGRVWACVALQWEWLGGQTPPRPQSRGRQRRQASAVAPSSERQHAGVRCVE
ncbi:MAG: lysophospholipid acyltransferase family protein [Solirubrobacteraceae bacterium]